MINISTFRQWAIYYSVQKKKKRNYQADRIHGGHRKLGIKEANIKMLYTILF